jgi:hypothetical protein
MVAHEPRLRGMPVDFSLALRFRAGVHAFDSDRARSRCSDSIEDARIGGPARPGDGAKMLHHGCGVLGLDGDDDAVVAFLMVRVVLDVHVSLRERVEKTQICVVNDRVDRAADLDISVRISHIDKGQRDSPIALDIAVFLVMCGDTESKVLTIPVDPNGIRVRPTLRTDRGNNWKRISFDQVDEILGNHSRLANCHGNLSPVLVNAGGVPVPYRQEMTTILSQSKCLNLG